MSNESHSQPRATTADHLLTLTRVGISAIPVVGSPAVELFHALVTPPLQKRQLEWIEMIAEGLRNLEAKFDTIIDDLKSNDGFVDTLLQASQAAARTSQQEKKEALRNAVLNAALPESPDESRQLIFINWVESFTPWHLRILKLFANPLAWFKESGRTPPEYHISSSLSGLLADAYPELKNDRPFYEKICKDLYNDGLLSTEHLHTMMSATGAFEMRATPLGNEFLQFISDPLR
jgi:hypothetical protein